MTEQDKITIHKLQNAIWKIEQAQQFIREAYEGDSAEETLEALNLAIEDLQTDIDFYSGTL